MNMKPVVVIATAITVLAGAPALADGDRTTAAPIDVTQTTLHPAPGEIAGPNFLNIAFENKHAVDAKKVVFDVRGGAYRQRIADIGTFAPGVSINHAFLDYSSAPERHVRVVEVDFADGTTWLGGDGE
jgi:hypothetical protein